ncbi:SusD/RagB family nutrient-binding outer membrane lipoprotein [Reichenbachiella agarivorans]|uniref:SusD/RagB family nutrient-binding outer membrane lipoprotein n=1 Tax=Reichenbachiella agarivorans TaxID=2979464 RepID=A0ABY6CQ96_9BACT|nr:SusD/RagB family nutrient-binding outer membrane lipoprotein [Reichenbachiella agarivorans]UXP32696.1 SusD/RagB family nutrient-binding outer membrane lipoprotein [Reichenbachiella agarivorans]
MKSIYKILGLILTLSIGGTGCDSYFEDYIASPNNPSSATPALMLSSIEIATFASYGGQLARQSSVMTQQMAGTSAGSQSIEIAQYNITELTNENEWNTIYAGAISDGNALISLYGDENPWYAGISKVLLALNFGLATDLWGNIPFDEAGVGILQPAYESQEVVLGKIQTLLSEAITDLQSPASSNSLFPTTDDFIFEGDVAKWISTAYVLKARYANRLSAIDPTGSATDALSYITSANMTETDDCNMIFAGGTALNQWNDYEASRPSYMRVCETFVDVLTASSDPRLPVLLSKDANGGYSGTPFDDVDVLATSYVGDYYASEDSPIPLVSYVESKFIEAEAQLRLSNASDAATAYNEAVSASILKITGASDVAYEGVYASETAATITLEKIMNQKWIALFIQVESYSDWRRTGFPVLTPNPDGLVTGIPVRLITPQNERLYNPVAEVYGNLLDPVWWDK